MTLKKDWLEEILLEDERARRILRLDEVSGGENPAGVGDNFTSHATRLKVDVMLESGKAHSIALVVKEPPPEGLLLDFLEAESFIRTELKMYQEILPLMKEVLEELHVTPLWPVFLGTKHNFILLSDLQGKGFGAANRLKKLDLEQTLLTVRGLAEFHAASVVLKQRDMLNVDGLQPPLLCRDSEPVRKYRSGALKAALSVITTEWGPEWKEIGERIEENATGIHDRVERLANIDENRLNVLCHGDAWTTNIFFKNSIGPNPSPVSVRFIDFQLSCYNSYGFDLIFLLGTSVPAVTRKANTVKILKSYRDRLEECLGHYGLEGLAPTLEEVQDEMARLQPYFFFVLFAEMPVGCSETQDPLELEKVMKDDGIPAHNPDIYRGNFRDEVEGVLLHWGALNLF